MTTYTAGSARPLEDPVSNVLKWVLLAVAVGSFALFAWATVLTYDRHSMPSLVPTCRYSLLLVYSSYPLHCASVDTPGHMQRTQGIEFAADSPLEQAGLIQPSVPRVITAN